MDTDAALHRSAVSDAVSFQQRKSARHSHALSGIPVPQLGRRLSRLRAGERFETRWCDHRRAVMSITSGSLYHPPHNTSIECWQFYEAMVKSAPLGRRNGLAELLVRVSKDCRDLLRVAILDLCA